MYDSTPSEMSTFSLQSHLQREQPTLGFAPFAAPFAIPFAALFAALHSLELFYAQNAISRGSEDSGFYKLPFPSFFVCSVGSYTHGQA